MSYLSCFLKTFLLFPKNFAPVYLKTSPLPSKNIICRQYCNRSPTKSTMAILKYPTFPILFFSEERSTQPSFSTGGSFRPDHSISRHVSAV
jgi:hypothetical protein